MCGIADNVVNPEQSKLLVKTLKEAADGLNDPYCNGNALAQSCLAAKLVYEFLGVPQRLGIHFCPGKHLLAPADWQAILDFADQQLRKLPVNKRFDQLPPAEELH